MLTVAHKVNMGYALGVIQESTVLTFKRPGQAIFLFSFLHEWHKKRILTGLNLNCQFITCKISQDIVMDQSQCLAILKKKN